MAVDQFKIRGKIVEIFPEKKFKSVNMTEFVLDVSDGEYERYAVFQIWGESTSWIDDYFNQQMVEVTFSVKSKEYKGKWFTSLNCMVVDFVEDANDQKENIPEKSDAVDMPIDWNDTGSGLKKNDKGDLIVDKSKEKIDWSDSDEEHDDDLPF